MTMVYHTGRTAVLIRLLLLSSLSLYGAQAQTKCIDGTWTYDRSTDTCFNWFMNYGKTWTESRDICRTYLGGSTLEKPGHLAKIGDDVTNTLVQRLVKVFALFPIRAWIGLYYSPQANDVRWDGFPDEALTFTDPANGTHFNLPKSAHDFGFIENYMWGIKTAELNDSRLAGGYVCQHYPLPVPNITCPSSPMNEGDKFDQPMSFQYFHYKWTHLSISTLKFDETFLCYKENQSCIPVNEDYEIVRPNANIPSTSLNFKHGLTRTSETHWNFAVLDSMKVIAHEFCLLEVYVPPSQAHCNSVWTPSSLTVNCVTDRVFPKPTCSWSYKYQEDTYSTDVLYSWSRGIRHDEYEIEEATYFNSTCYIALTQNTIPSIGQVGALVFEAQFFTFATPGIPTTTSAQVNVTIESPDAPVFRHMDGSDIGSLLILEEGDEDKDLQCEITTGIPVVQETKVTCGFTIIFSFPNFLNESKSSDDSNKFTIKATRNIVRKSCVCQGKHITGETVNTTLDIDVQYKTKIESFSYNDTRHALDVGDNFSLECLVEGNPSPSVVIFRHETTAADPQLEIVQDQLSHKANLKAKCSDNGRYQCISRNSVKGNIRQEEKSIIVYVNCPPTPCEESQPDPVFVVRPGDKSVLSLCLVAYPVPKVEEFSLEIAKGQDWQEYDLDANNAGTIELLSNSDNILERIDITLYKTKPNDLGQFRLAYGSPSAGSSTSHFLFQVKDMAELEADSDSHDTIIGLLVAVVVILAVVVVVLAVRFVMRKRMRNVKKDENFPNMHETKHVNESVYVVPPSTSNHEGNYDELEPSRQGNKALETKAGYDSIKVKY